MIEPGRPQLAPARRITSTARRQGDSVSDGKTPLKKLRGNPGKRALPKNEPQPTVFDGLPEPPDFLDAVAAAEWRSMGEELIKLRLFTRIDRAAFLGYCICYSRVVGIERLLTDGEEGLVSRGAEGGAFINPILNIQSGALKQMRAYLTGFGMDPSSRSWVRVPEAPKEDAFEKFRQGGGLKVVPKATK
jgi:P27 family predicted phage terminase small subunit